MAFEDFCDDLLVRMSASKPERKGQAASLSFFRGALALPRSEEFTNKLLVRGNVHPRHVWPIDVTTAMEATGEGHVDAMSSTFVQRVTTASERVRRACVQPRHFSLHETVGCFFDNATFAAGERAFGWTGSTWERLAVKGRAEPAADAQDTEDVKNCQLMCIIAMAQVVWWRVAIQLDGAEIAVPTDPSGVRAIFADRDRPVGKTRRAALKHWVRDHARIVDRKDGADETWVRTHLRGAETFSWHGMICRVVPSQVDTKLNQPTLELSSRLALEELKRSLGA